MAFKKLKDKAKEGLEKTKEKADTFDVGEAKQKVITAKEKVSGVVDEKTKEAKKEIAKQALKQALKK